MVIWANALLESSLRETNFLEKLALVRWYIKFFVNGLYQSI